MKQLVFVHGRSQEKKDAVALKAEWMQALHEGLAKSGLQMPIAEANVRFPYYGQTLYDLVSGADDVAEVVVRGDADANELRFQDTVIKEIQQALGITDEEVRQELAPDVVRRGPTNWEWVQGILRVIDNRVPGGSGASIALATRDVYQYLRNPGIRDSIERGITSALARGVPTVVVAHSLGTVVAYNMLRRDGDRNGWVVPLFVTLGSPLAITAIKRGVAPISHPRCVTEWFNAMDERDVVALYPLDDAHFQISPAIRNKTDVRNRTGNRHGIGGYLDDAEVARRIYDALT